MILGNALDDMHLDDPLNLSGALDRDLDSSSPTLTNSISVGLASSGLLSGSAPVNIPRSSRAFSPSTASPLQHLQTNFLDSFSSSKIGNFSGLFDFTNQHMSPSNSSAAPGSGNPSRNHNNSYSISPSISSNIDGGRMRDELINCRAQTAIWEERVTQARTACEAWQRETEEAKRKANIAEAQRDEAMNKIKSMQIELERVQNSPFVQQMSLRNSNSNATGTSNSELRNLSLGALKALHKQLRSDLEDVEKILYFERATKCMVCEEQNRSVTLVPCNHYVLCAGCAPLQKECPYCNMPISISNNM